MPAGPVVANNTPLVGLWVLNRLDLLRDLLLLAKERRLLPVLAPLIAELQEAGLYLAPSLVARTLELAGEVAT